MSRICKMADIPRFKNHSFFSDELVNIILAHIFNSLRLCDRKTIWFVKNTLWTDEQIVIILYLYCYLFQKLIKPLVGQHILCKYMILDVFKSFQSLTKGSFKCKIHFWTFSYQKCNGLSCKAMQYCDVSIPHPNT